MTEEISYQNIIDRFVRYAKINTRSDESCADQIPSTERQVVFLKDLAEELKGLGLSDVAYHSDDSYVTALLPSNDPDHTYPVIAFFAHVDTADFNAENIQPQVVKDYDGGVIPLGNSSYSLDPEVFPSLKNYLGQTLITTDGTTLLGADDKAGLVEIIEAALYLMAHPEIKHGDIKLAFGPDEEIGMGATRFNVERLAADFAYTMDGGPLGELQYETFNGASAQLHFSGKNVHPGTAKDQMINALQVAMDFHAALPEEARPEKTEGREGFYHLLSLSGTVEEAEAAYIIRDHDREAFEAKKDKILSLEKDFNNHFDQEVVKVDLADQYYNMGSILAEDMRPVHLAEKAFEAVGIEAEIEAVRGGTDGSILTYCGLPTPNIFAGGENMHGRYEYVSVQTMEKAIQVILAIVSLAKDYDQLSKEV
ncbi:MULTISPECIES: peptidase T [Aerococcus]|uniref:peptidase T n=1 Tax=Aerococcus TaxID=1375 RepID=UPI000AD37F39|nr:MULTISPECIES: peptidase T [Aerococcus]MDK7050915.1 peptidase T [Aerococcus sanguinicola]